MRRLPLTILGAATALGLAAATAQAEPVKLSPAQMDQLTAGNVSVSITFTSTSSVSSSTESMTSISVTVED
jgi:outer membrane lipoprotein-sorting protein